MELDENMKELARQLGVAINESLSASESVSEALAEIREAGYDVYLVLEATIGVQRREAEPSAVREFSSLSSGELLLTAQDAQFLKSLKIRIGGVEDRPSPAG